MEKMVTLNFINICMMKEGMIWQKLEREKKNIQTKRQKQKPEKELISYLHNSESAICFNYGS